MYLEDTTNDLQIDGTGEEWKLETTLQAYTRICAVLVKELAGLDGAIGRAKTNGGVHVVAGWRHVANACRAVSHLSMIASSHDPNSLDGFNDWCGLLDDDERRAFERLDDRYMPQAPCSGFRWLIGAHADAEPLTKSEIICVWQIMEARLVDSLGGAHRGSVDELEALARRFRRSFRHHRTATNGESIAARNSNDSGPFIRKLHSRPAIKRT